MFLEKETKIIKEGLALASQCVISLLELDDWEKLDKCFLGRRREVNEGTSCIISVLELDDWGKLDQCFLGRRHEAD